MGSRLLFLYILYSFYTALFATDHYVAPYGTPRGTGTLQNPWPLHVALAAPDNIRPGDTVWLRGGVYKGKFVSWLQGAPGKPIIVRSYPGEWARIDGNVELTLNGNIQGTDTTITLSDASLLVAGTLLRIDSEDLYVKSKTGNTVSVLRGWTGSDAKPHVSGSIVRIMWNILTINGSHTWYWGFEVMSSDLLRVTKIAGSAPPDIIRGTGISVIGSNTKLINLVVHDAGDGIGLSDKALNVEVYGCITYYTGWQGPDRGHGHGLYIQNSTGTKLVSDVISFKNFSTGMKAFGVTGSAIGVTFDGVISFNNGSVSGYLKEHNLYVGTNVVPADLITISDSILFHRPGTRGGNLHLGYAVDNNKRITVRDNYVAGGDNPIALNYWQAATVTGNTFYVSSLGEWGSQTLAFAKTAPNYPASALTWDHNTYFDESPAFSNGIRYTMAFNDSKNQQGGGRLSFEEWKNITGYDKSSEYKPTAPTGVKVFFRPNQYEKGRAHVAIFNWNRQDSVDVDLSQVLLAGEDYEIRDAQNYFGAPVARGVYNGSPVKVPMTLEVVAEPVGNIPVKPPHSAPQFGAFVVLRPGGNVSPGFIRRTPDVIPGRLSGGRP